MKPIADEYNRHYLKNLLARLLTYRASNLNINIHGQVELLQEVSESSATTRIRSRC